MCSYKSWRCGNPHEFRATLFDTAIRAGAGALLVSPALFFTSNQRRIAALAAQNRLPSDLLAKAICEAGGLMSVQCGEPFPHVAARRNLRGQDPQGRQAADLPVEQSMKFELVLNLQTAQAHG